MSDLQNQKQPTAFNQLHKPFSDDLVFWKTICKQIAVKNTVAAHPNPACNFYCELPIMKKSLFVLFLYSSLLTISEIAYRLDRKSTRLNSSHW